MLLLTSLLPCQELWALGEQLYLCMAVVWLYLLLFPCLKITLTWWKWLPEELRISVSPGRKCLYPSLRVVALCDHRMVELFRLEKSSKTTESHRAPSTAKLTTNPRSQVPHPGVCLIPPRDGAVTLRCLRSDLHRDHLHHPVPAPASPRYSRPAAPLITPMADPGARIAPGAGSRAPGAL